MHASVMKAETATVLSLRIPFVLINALTGKLAHLAFIEFYQSYLVKLTYNYSDFRVAFVHATDTHRHLSHQSVSLLHLLSKFLNILSFLLKVTFASHGLS